jgi:hypothetical protein
MLGLRVVNGDGGVAGIGRALVRWLLLVVDSLCGVLGLIVAAVTKPHRRVGDFAAGTYVIGKDDVGRPIDGGSAAVGAYTPAPAPPPQGFTGAGGPTGWSPPGTAPGTAPPPPVPSTPAEAPTTEVPSSGAPPVGTSAPQWDPQRNAWVAFDAPRNTWLRFDDASQQWRALD